MFLLHTNIIEKNIVCVVFKMKLIIYLLYCITFPSVAKIIRSRHSTVGFGTWPAQGRSRKQAHSEAAQFSTESYGIYSEPGKEIFYLLFDMTNVLPVPC